MAQRFLRALLGRRDREIIENEPAQNLRQEIVRLTVLGCGDAFGSGGRLQSSYHVKTARGQFLLDCGATTLIGMNRAGLDPNAVDCILISHLHGDHFAGLVWLLMYSHYVSDRKKPLLVAGPSGIRDRVVAAAEVLFPGSSGLDLRYPLEYREFANRVPLDVGELTVTPFEAVHGSGAPAHALRVEIDGHCLGFSGDTEWVDDLAHCARGADLFIVDCFGYESDVGSHMSWRTISERLDLLDARRLMLTHMGPEMLAKAGDIHDPRIMVAEDGLVLELAGGQVSRASSGGV